MAGKEAAAAADVSRETLDGAGAVLDELGELDQAAAGTGDTLTEIAAAAEQAAASGEPVVLEAGRYRVFQAPDGGWAIARAVNTCETCRDHGCGEQAEPILLPAMVIKLATMQGASLRDKLRALRAGGT